MLKNYFKIAYRNLSRNKLFSIINIVGLSIGVATVILLLLFVKDEWSFDRFHPDSDRIYRTWVKEHVEGDIFFNSITPYILGHELKENFPDFEEVVRYATFGTQVKMDNFSEQEQVHIVENGFFNLFKFPLLKGDKDRALEGVHQIVITEEIALKYLGDVDPIGKDLKLQLGGEWTNYLVTGIIERAPGNSSIQYDLIIPFENMKTITSEGGRKAWTIVNVETYLKVKKDTDMDALQDAVASLINQRVADIYAPGEYELGFQPIADIHLNKDIPVGIIPVSDGRYPKILAWIALLILLLGAINFTTIAIGRSVKRAKEVGVRKVNGATRKQLIGQFFGESILVCGLAVLIGSVLARIMLPVFNQFSGKTLLFEPSMINLLSLIGLALITGLLSGVYPAIIQSRFSPIRSLRGSVGRSGNHKHWVLRGLVTFQFILSATLIISTLVMSQQLNFLQSRNLGFDKEQTVILKLPDTGERLSKKIEDGRKMLNRLEGELGADRTFSSFAASTHTFGTPGWSRVGYTEEGSGRFRKFHVNGIDENFLTQYQIPIIEGRDFSSDIIINGKYAIVNKTYQQEFSVSVGEPMQDPFGEFTVIGIIDDFHFESLHNEIRSLALTNDLIGLIRKGSDFTFGAFPNPKISVKMISNDLPLAISKLKRTWESIAPDQAFEFSFLDENLDKQYLAEAKLSRIIGIATGLAIFIACLGLFGIASLSISQRTKEIGVRKVLGANVSGLFSLLSKEFLMLSFIAFLIASPIAYYLMKQWLQDFAYSVGIKWWIFFVAALLLIMITLSSISYQSIRAAFNNPVKALRTE
jgi:putative ABC transport system permease protein